MTRGMNPVGVVVDGRTGMILDEQAVANFLRMDETIHAMEVALAAFSRGEVVQPVRTMVPVTEHDGVLGLMPAYAGALGVKLVTFYPGNQGIPTHLATIMLFDPETGEPLVTMDGRLITEVRTAAVSAVATKLLARPNASVLAILGSGVQARSHLEALNLVHTFRDVRVWSPRNAAVFAREHNITAARTAEEAVRDADVVVVATSARTPVLMGRWLAPGTHINAVGACFPTWREMDDDLMRTARVFVDSREGALKESGDVMAAEHLEGEIGEVIIGTVPGRQNLTEITVFKSLGMAVEDVVTADLVYRKAQSNQA